MTNVKFRKRLDEAAEALYILNLEFGHWMDDSLENRVDQLQNLIDLELKKMNFETRVSDI